MFGRTVSRFGRYFLLEVNRIDQVSTLDVQFSFSYKVYDFTNNEASFEKIVSYRYVLQQELTFKNWLATCRMEYVCRIHCFVLRLSQVYLKNVLMKHQINDPTLKLLNIILK